MCPTNRAHLNLGLPRPICWKKMHLTKHSALGVHALKSSHLSGQRKAPSDQQFLWFLGAGSGKWDMSNTLCLCKSFELARVPSPVLFEVQEQGSIALANEASISLKNYAPGNPVFVGLANWAETCWSKALQWVSFQGQARGSMIEPTSSSPS